MKRSPLERRTPLNRGGTSQMKRSRMPAKRKTPRRRPAPRWGWDEWVEGNRLLEVRAGNACERCGTTYGPFERHHRKRRRDGGDILSNILLLCGGPSGCHSWVTTHPRLARQAGWIVSVTKNPAEVPVLAHGEWIILDDEGNATPAFLPDNDAEKFGPRT